MITREVLVKALRGLGYKYHNRCKSEKHEIYRKKGTTDRVLLKRTKEFPKSYAVQILKQAGMDVDDIISFTNNYD